MMEDPSSRITYLIDTFCELLGVDRLVTLAYRPQANGRVERVCKQASH
jgi:hypothetical protein